MLQVTKAVTACAALSALLVSCGPAGEQSADLGQVLDRTVGTLESYQKHLTEQNVAEASDDQVEEFRSFYTEILNTEPKFYDATIGVEIRDDATFLGYADANANGVKDVGEGKVFTVEIDEENSRLIATDVAGNATHSRFSGSGFLTGALIGHFIGRQRRAGIKRGSFNSRTTSARSAYKAPTSARSRARSGGIRGGK